MALASSSSPPFDYRQQRRCRQRAARHWQENDFLVREVAEGLAERWELLSPRSAVAVDLGCHGAEVAQAARRRNIAVGRWIALDPGWEFATLARRCLRRHDGGFCAVVGYESLPLIDAGVDVLLSGFYLHWINDLPGLLREVRRVLKPGGLFLAALAGAGTLGDLRQSLGQADHAVGGRAWPRVSPFLDIRMAGTLLQHAGFAEPVLSREVREVEHRDLRHLMRDLRGMGQTNAHRSRERRFTAGRRFVEAEKLYPKSAEGIEGGKAGEGIRSRFDLLYWSAWAP